MSASPILAEPLRERALAVRSMSVGARLALARLLTRAGEPVSIVSIHCWSRVEQGAAYLWAQAKLAGREDLPAPEHVMRAMRRERCRSTGRS